MPAIHVDRLASLYLARPFLSATRKKRANALSVLMYHSISDADENNAAPYYRVCTSPARFRAQISWLAENGYETVTVARAQQLLASGADISRCVLITFDDGFRDFHTEAFGILNAHHFTATMYLPTVFISSSRQKFKGRECLTWAEVRELRAAGMEFGSHTVNHPELVRLTWAEVESELRDSRTTIEQELQQSITSFAYPYAFPQANGEFTARFTELLERVGYRSCVTTEIGRVSPTDSVLRWRRLPINSCDDAELLEAKLCGDYDWLAAVQSLVKRVKTMTGR